MQLHQKPTGKNPARKPYDPERANPPSSKFVGDAVRYGRPWGDLPERVRQGILMGSRDLDQFPAEFREMLKAYYLELSKEEK